MKLIFAVLFTACFVFSATAQNAKDVSDATERLKSSDALLTQYMSLGDNSIPAEYLRNAEAVAFFPGVRRYSMLLSQLLLGNGVISVRSETGWNSPIFITLKGQDMNLKIADKKTYDVVVLFIKPIAVEEMKRRGVAFSAGSKLKIGVGPVVKGEGTDKLIEESHLLYYTFEKGQLTDVDFKNNWLYGGFGLVHNNDLNRAIFGLKTSELFAAPDKGKMPAGDIGALVIDLRDKLKTATAKDTVRVEKL